MPKITIQPSIATIFLIIEDWKEYDLDGEKQSGSTAIEAHLDEKRAKKALNKLQKKYPINYYWIQEIELE